MSVLLEIDRLCMYFGGVKAVHEVSFSVEAGEIRGLIGPNGSGKTTLFNCLTGLCQPTSGHIGLNGGSLLGRQPHNIVAAGISRTFQNLRLFSGMTALENVMAARHRHLKAGILDILLAKPSARQDHAASVEKAAELLDFCGLRGREDSLARELPYGMQRRLEIARALACEPKLLLLDEPAAGMNPSEAASLKALILAINRSGITVLLIEHNVRLVMGLCGRVTVLDGGLLIADDIPERIVKSQAVIEAYLGKEAGAHSS